MSGTRTGLVSPDAIGIGIVAPQTNIFGVDSGNYGIVLIQTRITKRFPPCIIVAPEVRKLYVILHVIILRPAKLFTQHHSEIYLELLRIATSFSLIPAK